MELTEIAQTSLCYSGGPHVSCKYYNLAHRLEQCPIDLLV